MSGSTEFRQTLSDVTDAASQNSKGMGTRAGNLKKNSVFNDAVQLAYARALKIPLVTFEKRFKNFIDNFVGKYKGDIIKK